MPPDALRATRRVRGRRSLAALVACLALIVIPVVGCGEDDTSGDSPTGSGAKRSATVNVASFKFVPDPIKVKAGGSVTWINQDEAPHTAETDMGTPGGFDTERLETGTKRTVRLDRPGRYSYFCVYHRFMTGSVEVVE